jgi:hypothetical protein
MHAALGQTLDEALVLTTPAEMVERWQETTRERFSMSLDDLLALRPERPLVAEGYGFLPALVAPVLSSPRQAIWLVPTEEFKLASFEQRVRSGGKGGTWARTSDPARARANHVARDLLIGDLVRAQARALGLTVVEVDGRRSLEETVDLVDAHFAFQSADGRGRAPPVR